MLTYDLDKRGNKTMYEYLYELIKEDISDGKLKADEKLPSKRGKKEGIMLIRLPWLQVVHQGMLLL